METRPLGTTGLRVPVLSVGAGPVSGLFTSPTPEVSRPRQIELLQWAQQLGIDWIDTAPGYGQGLSESAVGTVLSGSPESEHFRIATKVRLQPHELSDPARAIENSVEQSLRRLQRPAVTLLQLHNAITRVAGEVPDSVGLDDVLRPGGIAEGLARIQERGWTRLVGLTGLGETDAVEAVIESGRFATIQLPVNALLLRDPALADPRVGELALSQILPRCHKQGMGVFAIRVFAGGALAGAEPSPHTLRTRYFPMPVYRRDLAATEALRQQSPTGRTAAELALPPVLARHEVSSAIVGFSQPHEIREAVDAAGTHRG